MFQKVGGQMILCPLPFKMWGDMSPRTPHLPSDTHAANYSPVLMCAS